MTLLQYIVVSTVYFIIIMMPFALAVNMFRIMPDIRSLKVVVGIIFLIAFFYLSILARTAARIFVFEKKGFIESVSDANSRNLSTVTIWLCFIPGLGPIFQSVFQLDEETIKQKENRRKITGDA